MNGFERRNAEAAERTGELRAELVVHPRAELLDVDAAVAQVGCALAAFSQTSAGLGRDLETVDHDVHVVRPAVVEGRCNLENLNDAVDPEPHVAIGEGLLEIRLEVARLAARNRCEHHDLRAVRERERAVDDRGDRAHLQMLAVLGAVGHARAGEEKPHVVRDFGDGAHDRARRARTPALSDGDGGRKSIDAVDVGPRTQLKELPRISRNALHVAALPLRVKRVEGERTLAAARKSRDDRELVSRDIQTDVLEVVGARATHGNGFHHVKTALKGKIKLTNIDCPTVRGKDVLPTFHSYGYSCAPNTIPQTPPEP